MICTSQAPPPGQQARAIKSKRKGVLSALQQGKTSAVRTASRSTAAKSPRLRMSTAYCHSHHVSYWRASFQQWVHQANLCSVLRLLKNCEWTYGVCSPRSMRWYLEGRWSTSSCLSKRVGHSCRSAAILIIKRMPVLLISCVNIVSHTMV